MENNLKRLSVRLLAVVLTECWLLPSAFAGNIVITGHDDDHHAVRGSGAAKAQVSAMISFAREGAPDPTLPVLIFDHGTELQITLTALGIRFTNVDPDAGVPASSLFDVTRFSAIGVASDSSCDGCGNTATSSANLSGASESIASFFNKGGGIFAFTAAGNPNYYKFLPATVSAIGRPDPKGYTQTSLGATLSIREVNGDPTHNFFSEPGTGGVASLFQVIERYTGIDHNTGNPVEDVPVTLAIKGVRIVSGGFTRIHKNWLEALMDVTTLVATFGLLAFMVERLTNGIAIVVGYVNWWRERMEIPATADPETRARIDRNRRVGLFALSALLAMIGTALTKVNFLAKVGLQTVPAVAGYTFAEIAGYIVTGLVIAAGADPIREILKPGDRQREAPTSQPIQVTGTLIVQQAPPASAGKGEGGS